MTELLKLNQLSYEIKDVTIFKQISASVQQGDVIGIIGKNGSGKSTLLQLIAHQLEPTDGQVQWINQHVDLTLVEQESESHSFLEMNPYEEKLIEKWHVPTDSYVQLSGGEKLKARLARGLSMGSDLLLLDEPTNHLDEYSLQLLVQEIKQYNGTIILVSHDRYFLDEVVTKIWSIENKKVLEHKGTYSSYMEVRKQRRLAQQNAYEKQQKMIERIEGQMKELTSWSKKAHAQSTKQDGFKEHYRAKAKRMDTQVKSKQKRLEKELERAKVERLEPEYTVHFSMKANDKVGKRFLEVKNLSKSFNGQYLFQDVHFTILHGEKIAISGPNGSGKTTLIKIIMGLENATGDVWISPSANIGYLTQEVFDLPLNQTPEQLFYRDNYEDRGKVQNLMKHLGFQASQWKESIKHMSMGERVKCKLMAYILEEKDVLILDEPTNHLDLPSREQLEQTLGQYNGTLIVVSHDRYFVEQTTDTKLVISNRTIQKQLQNAPKQQDEVEELRLTLETERQEVLGRLSFMTPNDSEYVELDKRFNDLTKKINELKR